MKPVTPVALLVLALLAAGAAWWMASSMREPERVALPPIDAAHAGEAREIESAGFEVTDAEARAKSERAPAVDRRTGSSAPTGAALVEEPGDAIVIEGRVVLPPGLPHDEVLSVTARGRAFANGERVHVAPVEADGRFRARFAPRTETGRLELSARYAMLDESLRLDPSEVEGEVVLEPTLGGRIHGRVSLPPLRAGEEPEWDRVRIQLAIGSFQRATVCDAEGRFELGPLPTAADVQLHVTSEAWVDTRIDAVTVRAGEVTQVELALERGVALAGRVVDSGGAALEGVRIDATTTSREGVRRSWPETTRSDAEGRFELRGVRAGSIRLDARPLGFLDVEQSLGDLLDGERREGLVLQMEAGASLAGVVRWPDGRPARGASVDIEQVVGAEAESRLERRKFSATADESGAFRIAGLGPEVCELRASARPDERGTGASARIPARWEARRLDVRPGTQGLELVLSAGATVRGRVVNDQGEPVERFTITGESLAAESSIRTGPKAKFASPDGAFEMQGLASGRWGIRARAPDHVPSAAQEIDAAQEGARVELVLRRCARFSGRVVAPDGAPVAGASIHIERVGGAGGPDDSASAELRARTAAGGVFAQSRVEPGRIRVFARAEGFAPSEAIELELAPAQEAPELLLRLRRAARIEGVVRAGLDASAEREVEIVHELGRIQKVRTDARGEFAFGGLEPGRYRVVLAPSARERPLVSSFGALSDHETAVVLALGETARVVLPVEQPGGIVVEGRITAGDRPVSGCAIGWSSHPRRGAGAITDERGRYRVVLPEAGTWTAQLRHDEDWVLTERIEIPDARRVERDIALPIGRISGTVRDASGRGLAGVDVSLTTSSAGSRPGAWRQHATDERGRFSFAFVSAGDTAVRAGGPISGNVLEKGSYVLSERRIALAEGEALDGIDLVLSAGGSVAGHVLDAAGGAAGGTGVEARDAAGKHAANGWADGDGRFVLRGLTPGEYELRARSGNARGPSRSVRIEAGRTAEVDLVTAN